MTKENKNTRKRNKYEYREKQCNKRGRDELQKVNHIHKRMKRIMRREER
jgi:hypothetical protein